MKKWLYLAVIVTMTIGIIGCGKTQNIPTDTAPLTYEKMGSTIHVAPTDTAPLTYEEMGSTIHVAPTQPIDAN